VAAVTTRTARSNASAVRSDVACTPLTFRTYWRAAASISSGVATGSRPLSVVMFRHML
jgi:enoyl-CoA hydratase